MTALNLQYQNNVLNERKIAEEARSNKANEMETTRSNKERERETNRSNVVREKETMRHNVRTENESERHNKVSEFTEGIKAGAASMNAAANTVKAVGSLI